MRTERLEEVFRIARAHFPAGFPGELDDYSLAQPVRKQTPEYKRWYAAWERALKWPEWEALGEEIRRAFPGRTKGESTKPWQCSSRRHIVYFKPLPTPDGKKVVTRLVAAASVIAPFYLTLVTVATEALDSRWVEVHLNPPGDMRQHADKLARLIEQHLGYEPFPVDWASRTVTGLCIGYLNRPSWEAATLQEVFFGDDLDNLP